MSARKEERKAEKLKKEKQKQAKKEINNKKVETKKSNSEYVDLFKMVEDTPDEELSTENETIVDNTNDLDISLEDDSSKKIEEKISEDDGIEWLMPEIEEQNKKEDKAVEDVETKVNKISEEDIKEETIEEENTEDELDKYIREAQTHHKGYLNDDDPDEVAEEEKKKQEKNETRANKEKEVSSKDSKEKNNTKRHKENNN